MSTLRCLKMRLPVSRSSRSSQTLRNGSQNPQMSSISFRRQILVHAADAEIRRVHARAGRALVEHHQLLALLEAPQRRGERADIHRLRGDVEKVRQEPPDLAIEHADQLRAPRHREAEQLLGRETEGMLLVHRRDIVEPVEIRDRLQVGLRLDQLLGAAMQQPDVRVDTLDDLAVDFEHQTQHAVRRRMLRPEIDGEVAQRGLVHSARAVGSSFTVSPSRRQAGRRRPAPPRARGNRSCGIPASDAPARKPPASARRRSAPRRSR